MVNSNAGTSSKAAKPKSVQSPRAYPERNFVSEDKNLRQEDAWHNKREKQLRLKGPWSTLEPHEGCIDI